MLSPTPRRSATRSEGVLRRYATLYDISLNRPRGRSDVFTLFFAPLLVA